MWRQQIEGKQEKAKVGWEEDGTDEAVVLGPAVAA
jgi:hypothetical protein